MALAATPLLLTAGWMLLKEKGPKWAAPAYAAILIVVVCFNSVAFLAHPGLGLREIIFHIKENRQPGDALAMSRQKARTRAFIYYGATKELPPELGENVALEKDYAAIPPWLEKVTAGHERIWIVFYREPGKDLLYKYLSGSEDRFPPAGPLIEVGETYARVYDIVAGETKP